VWYSYTPSKRRKISVRFDNTGSSGRIGVYTGSQGSFSEVTCSYSSAEFIATPGTTYRILIRGTGSTISGYWAVWFNTHKLSASLSIHPNVNRINHGKLVRLKAHLSPSADPDNRSVRILVTRKGGKPVVLATGNVDANGDFVVFDKPTRDTVYSAEWDGDERYEAASTRPLTVHVRTKVAANLSGFYGRSGQDRLYRAGQPVRVNVAVAPNHAGSRVFFRLFARVGSQWRNIRLRPDYFRLGPRSTVSVSIGGLSSGYRYYVYVHTITHHDHWYGQSAKRFFRVTE
jgi:hypothetical protein